MTVAFDITEYQPKSWELHIKAESYFTKRFGKKVKAIGGKYSEARGYQPSRFVHVPNTPEGIELAQAILDSFAHNSVKPGRVTKASVVIARGCPLRNSDKVFYTKSVIEAAERFTAFLTSKGGQSQIAGNESLKEQAAERERQAAEVKDQIASLSQHPEVLRVVDLIVDQVSATAEIELNDRNYRDIVIGVVTAAFDCDGGAA